MEIYIQDPDGLIYTTKKAWLIGSGDHHTTDDTGEHIPVGSLVLVIADPDPQPQPRSNEAQAREYLTHEAWLTLAEAADLPHSVGVLAAQGHKPTQRSILDAFNQLDKEEEQ
jgi:hypothetical protein